jgi:hypothetical protein
MTKDISSEQSPENFRVPQVELEAIHRTLKPLWSNLMGLTLPGANAMTSMKYLKVTSEDAELTFAHYTPEEENRPTYITLTANNELSGTRLYSLADQNSVPGEFAVDGEAGTQADWEDFKSAVSIVERLASQTTTRELGNTALEIEE